METRYEKGYSIPRESRSPGSLTNKLTVTTNDQAKRTPPRFFLESPNNSVRSFMGWTKQKRLEGKREVKWNNKELTIQRNDGYLRDMVERSQQSVSNAEGAVSGGDGSDPLLVDTQTLHFLMWCICVEWRGGRCRIRLFLLLGTSLGTKSLDIWKGG